PVSEGPSGCERTTPESVRHRRSPRREGDPVPQSLAAFSAPAPDRARTWSWANFAKSCSLEVSVPMIAQARPIGTENSAGLGIGNHAKSRCGIKAVSEPDTTGEKITNPTAAIKPP